MKALVIDDSRAMRMILKGIIVEAGFEVIEAASVREGLQKLKEAGPFDLALVDWNLPEAPGLAFVEAARSDPANNAMRIMMVTTETEMSQMARALGAGANEYVMKPFTKPAIMEKLTMLGLRGGPPA
jgi:two-component system, chemotaxis family, chemotaxis protein CheY